MKVTVNGRETEIDTCRLDAMLTEIGIATVRRGIAVAVNGTVVPRSAWQSTRIDDGASIEIVGAVQGG